MTSTTDGGCDLTLVLSATNAACAISETYGVFVSPPASPDAGTAGGTGTRASPLHSIDAAITLAKTGAKRVYACVGYYDEKITVDATRDGVKIYGGLDCTTPTWDFTGDHTGLSPSTPGTTLTLTGLTSAHVEYFELRPIDAPQTPPTTAGAAGASSIAVFIENSTGVTFQNVLATGANAQPGQDQTAAMPAAAETSGTSGTAGGAQTVNAACMTSIGGAGGAAMAGGANGSPGEPTGTGGAAGIKGGACTAGGTGAGGAGSNGAGGTAGAGAASWGTLGSTGWTPANGAAGGAGGVGQGGGGGASATGNAGGGGGPGGCGGAGGLGGTGGGSSIGVLVHNSKVSIIGGSVQAGNGGNGGAGAPGQAGQAGGPGGAKAGTACGGGVGGNGGTGGGGGGGAGGISVGIVWGGATAQVTTDGMVVGPGQVASLNAVQGTGIGGPAGAGGAAGTDGGAGAGTAGMAGLGNDNIAALQIP